MKKNAEGTEKKVNEKKTKTKKVSEVEAEIQFSFRNATKGAIRFQELNADGDAIEAIDDEDGAIGGLYVRKNWLDQMGFKGEPESCTISITVR